MKYATFITQIRNGKTIQLPAEVCEKLRLEAGDRVEVSLKKIKSGRLDLILSENPLYKLINVSKSENQAEGK